MRERVRDGCWDWLAANCASFTHFGGAAATRGARLRAFGELAGIVAACLRRGVRTEPVVQLSARIGAALDGFDWESQAIRDPQFIVPLVTMAHAAQAVGRDARALRAAVDRRLELGDPGAFQIVPYRRLELCHLLARDGFANAGRASLAELAHDVLAGLDKPPSSFSAQDAYALTHTAFYLADDGARDAGEILAEAELGRLRWLVAICARMALVEDELDVLAELVVAARFLACNEPWLTDAAFARAARAQDGDGSLPTFRGAPPAQGDEARFLARYHATLMWAYAGTVG